VDTDADPVVENHHGDREIVANNGTAGGAYTTTRFVDGVATETQTLQLDAGESETVTFTTSFETAGTYAVTIGDLSPISVTVTEPGQQADPDPAPEPEPDESADDDGAGFGVAVTLVAVIAVIVLGMRRGRYSSR